MCLQFGIYLTFDTYIENYRVQANVVARDLNLLYSKSDLNLRLHRFENRT